ncbi:SDR family NAD(P)-dependent oxidoreductase [uncultured Shewanella sp.]|uniref:SDR family NAD(P)-dependent oxidoreductase n=1 Tax=uncultured Shewanella sp. TaxID=173975 RepID=UPI00261A01A4|nr:SDR family NAD(P)-dependent oxidoreductase [uncultured Shewanella sp.]
MFITDRHIVITGAASGVGLGIAQYCLQNKAAQLFLLDCDFDGHTNHQLIDMYAAEKNVNLIPLDIRDDSAVKALSNKLSQQVPCIDMVINCAGVSGPFGAVWEVPKEQVDWTLAVNLTGTVNIARHFLPLLQASTHDRPCFVSVSSHLGLVTKAHLFSYQMAKHAVVAFTEALQQDCQLLHPSIQFAIFFPYFVKSNLANSGRHLAKYQKNLYIASSAKNFFQGIATATEKGIEPIEAAKILFDGLENKAFYIFTDEQTLQDFQQRVNGILKEAFLG